MKDCKLNAFYHSTNHNTDKDLADGPVDGAIIRCCNTCFACGAMMQNVNLSALKVQTFKQSTKIYT